MRYSDLFEARTAPLFHFTRLDKLMPIVQADKLGIDGVSLTRDANTPFFSHGFWNHVALVLDQEKLSQRYAFDLRAGDVVTGDSDLFMKADQQRQRGKEAEERIERPISPLHPYLRAIVVSDSEITTRLMFAMRKKISGKPLAKWWPKFEAMIKRQGTHPNWNQTVLDPDNWKLLFDYCRQHEIKLMNQPLRTTFGGGYNLWQRNVR